LFSDESCTTIIRLQAHAPIVAWASGARSACRSAARMLVSVHRKTEGGAMLHFVWMFVVGIVVGAIARFILPGAQNMGILMTGVLGIVGSFAGGFIARIFSRPPEGTPFHPAGILLSIVGAVIVLWAWNHFAT
jgi:uncharacterized membrane protein YeaQ/YmgE (transglycosylase-associated protein family)